MESDDNLGEDEEEILVYVEFEGSVSNNTFSNKQLQLDIIGIDTERPVMQINGRFYEGTYEDAIGTYMFFEKDDNPVMDDIVFDSVPSLKYISKTRKLLKMQRVFVKQRTEVLGDSENMHCVPNMDMLKQAGVPPKYQQEALSFWEKLRDDRMNALCAYLEKQRIREEKKLQGIALDSESDEDNPFAMYKQKEESADMNKVHDMNEDIGTNSLESCDDAEDNVICEEIASKDKGSLDDPIKVTVTDPGPSTSQNSELWTGASNPKAMHKATFQVIRKKRGRILREMPKRKQKKKQPNPKPEISSDDNDQRLTSEDTPQDVNNIKNTETKDSMVNESVSTSESVTVKPGDIEKSVGEICRTETSSPISNEKKLKKQSKQEAKMKEISGRLKIVAEEYLKTRTDK